jgi:hypothetical protein
LLSPESYQTAWLSYIGATVLALGILYFWVGPRLGHGLRLTLALLLAALALTPAHPAPDVETWAPAIFVAGFELLTSGAEAASRPLRSLLIAEGMLLALCLVAWVALRSLRRGSDGDNGSVS